MIIILRWQTRLQSEDKRRVFAEYSRNSLQISLASAQSFIDKIDSVSGVIAGTVSVDTRQ